MKRIFFIIIFFCIVLIVNAQSAHSYLREADKNYKEQKYNLSEENYRKALEKEPGAPGNYNLGNAIYNQERYEEALSRFEAAANNSKDETVKAQAYHNLGNTHFKQQAYDKSVDAYKNALRLNPRDVETKTNLAIAQRQLRIQQEQQKKNQQQQNQQNQQKEEEQNQTPDQQQQQDQQNQQQQPDQPGKLSKEEARKLLEIMEQEEQKVQQKLRKAQTKPNRSSKDW